MGGDLIIMKKDMKQYQNQIKLIIAANITYIKKRLNVFPKSILKKINRLKLENRFVEVHAKEYSTKELIQEILDTYKRLHKETLVISYTNITRPFMKECKENPDNLQSIYEKYRNMLTERLKTDKDELYFCLDAIKILEKKLKETSDT